MMMTHAFEQRVLVITMHDDPGIAMRAALLAQISDLVQGHKPASVVIVLDQPSPTQAALSIILRADHLCSRLGLVMFVATPNAHVRRLLAVGADTRDMGLVIYARADTAIATATARTTGPSSAPRPPTCRGPLTQYLDTTEPSMAPSPSVSPRRRAGSVRQRTAPARSEC